MAKFQKALIKGIMVGMILTDFKKAFDTIDYDVLLQKLCFCFLKHTVNWFKSYLTNRSFLFNLENNFQQLASISCDLLEGFILGHSCY